MRSESPLRAMAARSGIEHRVRNVEPVEAGIRIAPRGEDEVAPGAARDLEHAASGGRLQLGEQAVAAEQIVFARRVVDVALVAVDGVHVLGRGRVGLSSGLGASLGAGVRAWMS